MRYVMDGLGFTILSETPCAEPHAGCCGGWGLKTLGYPIKFIHLALPEEPISKAILVLLISSFTEAKRLYTNEK